MHYTLLAYESPASFALRDDPNKNQAYVAGWTAYTKTLIDAGILVSGAGLQLPDTATTVALIDGKRQVQDGPYADTKEQLGGFYIIDVANLDTALEWAARVPAGVGSVIEVRPNIPPPSKNVD